MEDAPLFARDYQRPDLEEVERTSRQLAAAAAAADSAGLLEVVQRWNRLRSTVDTQLNIAMVLYHQNTNDHEAQAEQDFWDNAAPLLRELDAIHARAVLACPQREAIERKFGRQMTALAECTATTFAPEIKEALAEEAKLVTRHVELTAKPEVEFRGRKYSMDGIAKFFTDSDRATRLEAQQARDAFLGANREELDSLYDRLVELRHGMGRALGHESFIPLGYELMMRTGYGPDEVARFRKALRDEIVPIAQELKKIQRERLGVDEVAFHDEPIWDQRGNPTPVGDESFILENVRTMFHELGPELGEFMDLMMEKKLIDVEIRDGKAPGGFCTEFIDLGIPFVFANFRGTDDDVVVITHECGHAFQSYSSRDQPLVEYAFPTYEACEVHSMGMEFLAYPWMDRFFGADAERYRRVHLERAVDMLPYIVAVDEYQHRVYAEPGRSPAERNQLWLEMEATYLPHRRYRDLPYLEKGTIWQRQAHIYQMPFYYIDYALAEICAMQIFERAARDRKATMEGYLAMCRVGGSVSFPEMLEIGGLESPFEPSCLRTVADHVRSVLLS